MHGQTCISFGQSYLPFTDNFRLPSAVFVCTEFDADESHKTGDSWQRCEKTDFGLLYLSCRDLVELEDLFGSA